MSFEIGQQVRFNDETLIIVEIIKGGKTKKPNMHDGIITGYVSKPKRYKLSNEVCVKGNTLLKHKNK